MKAAQGENEDGDRTYHSEYVFKQQTYKLGKLSSSL